MKNETARFMSGSPVVGRFETDPLATVTRKAGYWQPGTTMDAGYSRWASVFASAIIPIPPPNRILPQNIPPNSEFADCMTCFPSGVRHETRRVSSDFGIVTVPGGCTVQAPFL